MRRSVRDAALLPLLLTCACAQQPDEPSDATPAAAALPARLFRDVTAEAKLAFDHEHGGGGEKYLPEIMGSGGAAIDYDGDGWTDLYFVQAGRLPGTDGPRERRVNRLYRNRGDGTFEDVTMASGTGDDGYGMGAVAGDVDNDGDTDLYVVNLGPDRLLINQGDGSFRDGTVQAGILSPLWGSSAVLFDADLDGWLDLYVVNYLEFSVASHVECGYPTRGIVAYCHPDVYPMAPDAFFRNRGDGTFSERTVAAGFEDTTGKGLGAVAADFTDDGWPDLYVANDSTPNFLYRNLGGGTFREDALFLGVGFSEDGRTEAGMGVAAGDVDGDGLLDIFVTNLSRETNALYLGGTPMFRYATREVGLYEDSYMPVGFGTELVDLDNDGDLDLVVTNGHVIDNIELTSDGQSFRQPSQVFFNDGGARFAPISEEMMRDLRIPRVGRGTIRLDYDRDGRQDLAVTFNQDRARLFRNEFRDSGAWITLEAMGRRSNRDAVGLRARVEVGGRSHLEERVAGSSYQTSGSPTLHFGLGRLGRAERIRVTWPNGVRAEFHDLPAGRRYRLLEPARRPR